MKLLLFILLNLILEKDLNFKSPNFPIIRLLLFKTNLYNFITLETTLSIFEYILKYIYAKKA